MSIVLSKLFERESPLLYFHLWDRCDREGLSKFTQQSVRHNLFIAPPAGTPGSVWYSEDELHEIEVEALRKINADPALQQLMITSARSAWDALLPYLEGKKTPRTGEQFLSFYESMVGFWYTMNTPYYRLPGYPELNAHFLAELILLRNDTQEYSSRMRGYLTSYFKQVFPDYGHFAMVVTPEDVRQISEGNGSQLLSILERRLHEGCFLLDESMYFLPSLAQELKKHDLVLETVESDKTEVIGTVGYKGIARGPVCVARTKADLLKLKDGDVLVSVMTDPSYVSAMQRATAFVTDEGGTLSHAAIVAREMKKPCVIGTKIATQIFKDGDLVEVDADNGIVRKI